MNKKELCNAVVEGLKALYPAAECSLTEREAYRLLIAVRLSAQCTDARVNMVTPALYEKYPTLEAFADAEVKDVEELIRSCGFYHTKARDIINSAKMILTDFNGKVPDNMDDLLKLPGVGRKTANLILGDVFNVPSSVVVDTHCIRLTNRIGLVATKDPVKIEMALRQLLPPDKSSDFCHRMVLHGRAVCNARSPKCEICSIKEHCDHGKNID